MALFVKVMQPFPGMRVLDLGGQPMLWDSVQVPLNITCINLPGIARTDHPSHHHITYLEGDACSMPDFKPGDFDLVFSNSVIEHVGDSSKRLQFAHEILRLSNTYWVQTPSIYFPIEAHCGMPFWWLYPQGMRSYFLTRWKQTVPEWTEMVETTAIVSERELRSLLPSGNLQYEWFLGIPKSMVVYSK